MAEIKPLLDEYGVIHEATKILPDVLHKVKFLHLKDIIEGQRHDDVVKVIQSKKDRYL